MIQYTLPVRNNTPQQIGPYTFKDQNKTIINLTGYVSVMCELRQSGLVLITTPGRFVSQTGGTVQVDSYTFTTPGVWQVQFYCVDASNNKLYGEPIQLTIAKNEDDAALTDAPLIL